MEVTRVRKFATGSRVMSDGYHVTLSDKDLDETEQKLPFVQRMKVLIYRCEWALFVQAVGGGDLSPEEQQGWGQIVAELKKSTFPEPAPAK